MNKIIKQKKVKNYKSISKISRFFLRKENIENLSDKPFTDFPVK
jgi:hypothetical protein